MRGKMLVLFHARSLSVRFQHAYKFSFIKADYFFFKQTPSLLLLLLELVKKKKSKKHNAHLLFSKLQNILIKIIEPFKYSHSNIFQPCACPCNCIGCVTQNKQNEFKQERSKLKKLC